MYSDSSRIDSSLTVSSSRNLWSYAEKLNLVGVEGSCHGVDRETCRRETAVQRDVCARNQDDGGGRETTGSNSFTLSSMCFLDHKTIVNLPRRVK